MMWKTPVAQHITRRNWYDGTATNEAAPAGVGAPVGPGPNPYEGGAVKDSSAQTGSLAARLDGCPTACGNAELPFGAFQPPSGGLVGLYKCTTCGHRWHVSWREATA